MSKGLVSEAKKITDKTWALRIDGQSYLTRDNPSEFVGKPVEFDYKPTPYQNKVNNWLTAIKEYPVETIVKEVEKQYVQAVPTVSNISVQIGEQFSNELLNKSINTCMMGAVELTKAGLSNSCVETFKALFKAMREV